jgi:hypothetical protein
MITTYLIHAAIWTQLVLAHGNSMNFDLRAALPPHNESKAQSSCWRWPDLDESEPADPPHERVVLLPITSSRKPIVNVEPATSPDDETISLYNDVYHFASRIDWVSQRETSAHAAAKTPIGEEWNKRFAIRWDENWGLWLAGKFFPRIEDCVTAQQGETTGGGSFWVLDRR